MKPTSVFAFCLLAASTAFAASPARQVATAVTGYTQWKITDLGPYGEITGYYLCGPDDCKPQGYLHNGAVDHVIGINVDLNRLALSSGTLNVLRFSKAKVADTVVSIETPDGIGIDPDKAEEAFEQFQIDSMHHMHN